jgi:hypothetical protein
MKTTSNGKKEDSVPYDGRGLVVLVFLLLWLEDEKEVSGSSRRKRQWNRKRSGSEEKQELGWDASVRRWRGGVVRKRYS